VTVKVPHDIALQDVTTVEDLVGGEFVHTLPPDDGAFWEDDREPEAIPATWKPNCPEAERAIRKGIDDVLRPQIGLYRQNRDEAYVEVIHKLGKYLRRRYRKFSGPHRITHKKFLQSPNRGGWLYLFAMNTTLEWLGERIRRANGDERIKQALVRGVVPAETFTEQQDRKAAENESLTFDRHIFAGGRGHGPDEMTILSDHHECRSVEHASHGDAELVAAIRDEVNKLPTDDQEFFWDYLDSRYQAGGRSHADRQRFHRLRLRIRKAVSQIASNFPYRSDGH
jgi:hypothetical protein